MGKGGFALKLLQWFLRGVEFCCAIIVLGLTSYFLALAHHNGYTISPYLKAVEGMAGIAVIYTAIGLLLLCCLAGKSLTSFIAIVLDIVFMACFVFITVVNRHGGTQSCSTESVWTHFGTGPYDQEKGEDWPSYRFLCLIEKAIFAVSIVAIFFFLLSALAEVALARHHKKEKAFGPSPANNYTSGSAKKGGFMSRFGRKKQNPHMAGAGPNTLPTHTEPSALRTSYATDTTAIGNGNEYTHDKYQPAHPAYGNQQPGYQQQGVTGSHF